MSLRFIMAISITGLIHAIAIEILTAKNMKYIKVCVCLGAFSTGVFSRAKQAFLVILTIMIENIKECTLMQK